MTNPMKKMEALLEEMAVDFSGRERIDWEKGQDKPILQAQLKLISLFNEVLEEAILTNVQMHKLAIEIADEYSIDATDPVRQDIFEDSKKAIQKSIQQTKANFKKVWNK